MNAFVVLFLIMGIWAIMGVEFFNDACKPDKVTGKNLCQTGMEFHGWIDAMFTLWQVMTMDSWASIIGRDIMYGPYNYGLAGIYFISFLFVSGIGMMNAVIAILLEKYLTTVENLTKERHEHREYLETLKPKKSKQKKKEWKKTKSKRHRLLSKL